MDPNSIISAITEFLRNQLEQSGMEGYVVGLSGGIDSSLAAALAVRAVGAEAVYGLFMPYQTSSPDSGQHAKLLSSKLNIKLHTIEITPMVDAYYARVKDSDRVRIGNKMARERMSILFDFAHRMRRLVLGTGNRTEACLGYTTLYGDSACSVNPIGQLYKNEIRQLAREIGLPAQIIDKPPSADLWVDQTDEGEIGVTYDEIDRLLNRIVDNGIRSRRTLLDEGFRNEDIDRVLGMFNLSAFKRGLPPVAAVGKADIPDRILLDD